MNLEEAFSILELDSTSNLTIKIVKNKYHKMALKWHPDKNADSSDTTSRFQKINEAYDTIMREMGDNEPKDIAFNSYDYLLKMFIRFVTEGQYNEVIISAIISAAEGYSLKMFENLSQEQSVSVYYFLLKNKSFLRINDTTLDKVKQLLFEKFKDIQIFYLNPSLNDLLNSNVYRLDINKVIYFVPLWHSELYFDSDIIVKCNPELPDNVEIDEDNNLLVEKTFQFSSILEKEWIPIHLGDLTLNIPVKQLYIRPVQKYSFKGQGILRVDEDDIYNENERGDIIIKLKLV
jgi:DnaJ domain